MLNWFIHDPEPSFVMFYNKKVMFTTFVTLFRDQFPEHFLKRSREEAIKAPYTKIAIIRNPYNRTASAYMDKCLNDPQKQMLKEKAYLALCQHELLVARNILRGEKQPLSNVGVAIYQDTPEREILTQNYKALMNLSFEEYLELLKILFRYKKVNDHFCLQVDTLSHRGQLIIDHLFKMESINQDWNKVCQLMGRSLTLPHENKGSMKNYDTLYTSKLRDTVFQLYKLDFINLGYQF